VPTAYTPTGFQNSAANDVQDPNARTAAEAISVAVIEDDEQMRRAIIFQLRTAGFQVTPHSSAEEFLKVPDTSAFDCIVADVFLPRMNGLQLQEELHRSAPFASIVFITGQGDLSLGMHAMRKGAVDFLEKPVDDQALLTSITRGAELSRKRRVEQVQRVEFEKRQGTLTARERQVFLLITEGLLNKQVGAELGISERTVKAHRERVMNKMGADSFADLVRMAEILQIRSARGQSV
jgi:two-component system, LuxR family, response regulator FixJ